MLSEINQSQKDKYHTILHMEFFLKSQTHSNGRMVVTRGSHNTQLSIVNYLKLTKSVFHMQKEDTDSDGQPAQFVIHFKYVIDRRSMKTSLTIC